MKYLLLLIFIFSSIICSAQSPFSKKRKVLSPKQTLGLITTFVVYPTTAYLLATKTNNPNLSYTTLPILGGGMTILLTDIRRKK